MSSEKPDRYQEFSAGVEQYIGRALSAPEKIVLASIFPALVSGADAHAVPADAVTQARLRAAQAVEEGRKRASETISSTLHAVRANNAPTATTVPDAAQITRHLAELVRSEVERCFEQRFGEIHKQMTEALSYLNQMVAARNAPPSDGA
jgi:Glu-tRNA(Gln) amidotransferase subunit E-like FAD-binding protein